MIEFFAEVRSTTIPYRNVLLASVFIWGILSCTQDSKYSTRPEFTEQDCRMEWWREARFGMFITWNISSQAAGEWEGEKIPWAGEWIMATAKIPVNEYEKLAEEFNPKEFNAENWVLLAKQAGMKYIVIIAKHHDGFAMYHSKASKYNIVDATPFDRDPLIELAEACRKYGMRLGIYYSHALDWHEPGGSYVVVRDTGFVFAPRGTPHWDPDLKQEPFMNYFEKKSFPQVKELLENYGQVDILWWDFPYMIPTEAAEILADLAGKYPGMLTNNRLYDSIPGDFTTPEQHVPSTGLDYDWEVCMTMNNSWGYKYFDNDWKSSEILIRMLVDIASKGGNLLLNVGPSAEGLIPGPSVDRLKDMGDWMKVHDESIYGTNASPFSKLPWGRCTSRETKNGTTLYLHVFNWPGDQVLRVPRLNAKVKSVHVLSEKKQRLSSHFEEGDLLIDLPEGAPNPIVSVVVVETRGAVKVTQYLPASEEGKIVLPAAYAEINNSSFNNHALLEGWGDHAKISNWIDPHAWLLWTFSNTEPGTFRVQARVKIGESVTVRLEVGEDVVITNIPGGDREFHMVDLGTIQLPEAGEVSLELHPVAEIIPPHLTLEQPLWPGIELAGLELIKYK